jgi:hypothetical protein
MITYFYKFTFKNESGPFLVNLPAFQQPPAMGAQQTKSWQLLGL